MPVFVASCPVSRLVRLGQHRLVGTIALVKSTPRPASSRVTFGIDGSVPVGWSSVRISTTSHAAGFSAFFVVVTAPAI